MCQPLSSTAHNQLLHRSGSYHCHVMPVRMREGVTERQTEPGRSICGREGEGRRLQGLSVPLNKRPRLIKSSQLEAGGNVTEVISRATNDYLLNEN